jgi:hypothetical protein
VEQLKHVTYFHRQVAWLQERFPKAELDRSSAKHWVQVSVLEREPKN